VGAQSKAVGRSGNALHSCLSKCRLFSGASCADGCSGTPHVASKTASKLFGSLQEWAGNVRTFCFSLITVVDVLLVREFLHAGPPWVSRARGVEWPPPVRGRQNQARLSPQRDSGHRPLTHHTIKDTAQPQSSDSLLPACLSSLEALAQTIECQSSTPPPGS
jgi:hypothetical protein